VDNFRRWVPCPRLRGQVLKCSTAAPGCVFSGRHLQTQLVGGHSERCEESLWSIENRESTIVNFVCLKTQKKQALRACLFEFVFRIVERRRRMSLFFFFGLFGQRASGLFVLVGLFGFGSPCLGGLGRFFRRDFADFGLFENLVDALLLAHLQCKLCQ